MASLMKNLAPDYSSSKSYKSGDHVIYNNKLYQCVGSTTGSFDADKWDDIYLSDLMKGGGNSTEIAPVLLWTNPSPTASFAAQTVALDLSDYSGVIVEFNPELSYANRLYLKKGETNKQAGALFGSTNIVGREVSVTSSGVYFADGKNGNLSTNNAMVIPLKIYGVKKVVVEVENPIDLSNVIIYSFTGPVSANTSTTYSYAVTIYKLDTSTNIFTEKVGTATHQTLKDEYVSIDAGSYSSENYVVAQKNIKCFVALQFSSGESYTKNGMQNFSSGETIIDTRSSSTNYTRIKGNLIVFKE